jgi:RHS repeat-associated protein
MGSPTHSANHFAGTTTDFYYSSAWQLLEERVNGQAQASAQYVWSPVYVDALILRDRDTNGDGTLDGRLWVQHNANYNVTALLDNSGNVVERYAYDAFGLQTVFDANWNSRSGSSYSFAYGFQGWRFDVTSGVYFTRYRVYSPSLGRWLTVDPMGFAAEDQDLYRAEGNNSANNLDPTGLDDNKGGFLRDTGAVARNWWRVARGFWQNGLWGGMTMDTPPDWEQLRPVQPDDVRLPRVPRGGTNIMAGIADGVSNDTTDRIRDSMESNNWVDKDSAGYKWGWRAGWVLRQAIEVLIGNKLGMGECPGFGICFPAGTLVSTEHGHKAIDRLTSEDRVWGFDFMERQWRLCSVLETHETQYDGPLATLQIGEEEITATSGHPFWVVRGEALAGRPTPRHAPAGEPGDVHGRWVMAADLRVGDELLLHGGETLPVERVVVYHQALRVYNISVAGLHNYCVGCSGVLVHNPGGDCPKGVGEQARDPLGRFLRKIGDERRPGSLTEEGVWDAVSRKPGWRVIEGRVTVRGPNGEIRVYDGAAISPKGHVIGLETKSGSSPWRGSQRTFDRSINNGNPAAAIGKHVGLIIRRVIVIRR